MMDPEQFRRALSALERELADSQLTKHDLAMLKLIHDAVARPLLCQKLIHRYYGDLDRADRTPRGVLYLHMGLIMGMLHDALGVDR